MKKLKGAIMAMAVLATTLYQAIGADYNQSEDFGAKSPGDKVGFTASPPGEVISGKCTSDGGFTWSGSDASWNGTIPDDFSGNHAGAFDGEYVMDGKEGEEKTFTWHVNTKAVVQKVEITKYDDRMLVEGEFDMEAKANPEIQGEKYTWSLNGISENFDPNPSDDGKTKFTAKFKSSSEEDSVIKLNYSVAEDNIKTTITAPSKEDWMLIRKENETWPAPYSGTFHILYAEFQCTMYDQFDTLIIDSWYGDTKKTVPFYKEEIYHSGNLSFRPDYTEDWQDCIAGWFIDRYGTNDAFEYGNIKQQELVREGSELLCIEQYCYYSVNSGMHQVQVGHHVFTVIAKDVLRTDPPENKLLFFNAVSELQ